MKESAVTSDPLKYRERTYRNRVSKGRLTSFHIQIRQTDLWISARQDLSAVALQYAWTYRRFIEEYIRLRPEFLTSFSPLKEDPMAPPIIRDMLDAAQNAGVGPMAAVAGAIAQYVGKELLSHTTDLIVENGGDIFLQTLEEVRVGIFAGESPLSHKFALRLKPERMPLGVCTSSGTVGHSISLGRADAVCVISSSAILADAAATAVANKVKSEHDIRKALDSGMEIEGVQGVVVILGDKVGLKGDLEIAQINKFT